MADKIDVKTAAPGKDAGDDGADKKINTDEQDEDLKKATERAEEAEKERDEWRRKAEAGVKPRGEVLPDRPVRQADYTEEEWAKAETQYGMTRDEILSTINAKIEAKREAGSRVAVIETKFEVEREKSSRAAEDPLYPKYRKEVEKFLADIPQEFMSNPEGRKKWIDKAFDYGKRALKTSPSTRVPPPTDTRSEEDADSAKGNHGRTELSAQEEDILKSHGVTLEDYKKIQHPWVKDGIMIRERPEEPRFGQK